MGKAPTVLAMLCAMSAVARGGPVTEKSAEVKACEKQCTGVTGVVCADALMVWRKPVLAAEVTRPDHACAAKLYRYACGVSDDGDVPKASHHGDAGACMDLADLTKTGWLFEVARDPDLHRDLVDRAHDLAVKHCVDADATGCAVAARAAQARSALLQSDQADRDTPVRYAERGCTQGQDLEACRVLVQLASAINDKPEVQRRRETTLKTAQERYKKNKADLAADVEVAYQILYPAKLDPTKPDPTPDPARLKQAAEKIIGACTDDGHARCAAAAYWLVKGSFGITANSTDGIALAKRRCDLGERDACWVLAFAYSKKGPDGKRDETEAMSWAERTCSLATPEQGCVECKAYPTLSECQRRAVFARHDRCYGGDVGTCMEIGKALDGKPVTDLPEFLRRGCAAPDGGCVDLVRARYFRQGCDGGSRLACDALSDLCKAETGGEQLRKEEVCEQALIHTDLFYVAEQYPGDNRTLVDPKAGPAAASTRESASIAADAKAGPGAELRRGTLDADLVVDIVLDRARQAAIGVVVRELIGAGKQARYGYLADLFDQGSRLLLDPSTLRREKFQDLGMTMVRAFVAANLVDGMFPTARELTKAVAGPTGALSGLDKIVADILESEACKVASKEAKKPAKAKPESAPASPMLCPDLRNYLVDTAYQRLGQFPLFRRSGSGTRATARGCPAHPDDADPPCCPWPDGAGDKLCQALAKPDAVEALLGVDRVLDGLSLAKALRDADFDKVRPLIEAVKDSPAIADFKKTHGLNLATWSKLVTGSRDLIAGVRTELIDVRQLTLEKDKTFGYYPPDLGTLAGHARGVCALLDFAQLRQRIGSEHRSRLMRIVAMIRQTTKLPGDCAAQDQVAPLSDQGPLDHGIWLKLREAILKELEKPITDDLLGRITGIEDGIAKLEIAVDALDTSIDRIRRLFESLRDGEVSFDVAKLPLHAIGELENGLKRAAAAMKDVATQLETIDPERFEAPLRLARSATARLLAFLDLMGRIARSSRVSQRCEDVVAALGSLGSKTGGKFTAPLYDVLEPVLGAIKAHEPMTLDLLFAVIARVRLDTLVASLQGDKDACKTAEGGIECWTVKLIHALQESVERDGDLIRIDGGKFAQRLARHGDEFQRKHKWRGYFHLTVGLGGMYSDPVGDTGSLRRGVPVISEQVGFGFASPSFWGNNVTFKIGAGASGLLYRAVLDSEESDAIMVHPILLAFDVGDLVEAYVSPAMVLLYPPSEDRDTAVRWGFGAGLSVPLGSYLERLK